MFLFILEIIGWIGILGVLGFVLLIVSLKQYDDIVVHLNNYRIPEDTTMSCCNRKTDRLRKNDIVNNCKNLQKFLSGSKSLIAAFTKDEIKEIKDYITFYEKNIISKTPQEVDDFVICSDTIHDMHIVRQEVLDEVTTTIVECYSRFFKMSSRKAKVSVEEKLCSYLGFLSSEAMTKGFESILTYVRFLKLSILKKNGMYHIVSEEEQSHIKNWVHMNRKFQMKWGIFMEIATSNSRHIWNIS